MRIVINSVNNLSANQNAAFLWKTMMVGVCVCICVCVKVNAGYSVEGLERLGFSEAGLTVPKLWGTQNQHISVTQKIHAVILTFRRVCLGSVIC